MSETKNDEHGPDKREPTYTHAEVVRLIVAAVVTPPTWGSLFPSLPPPLWRNLTRSEAPMTDPIDYSRPVGWWCAYCEEDGPCFRERVCISMGCKKVPVYLPLPTPEPVEVDEVETGEAEVVMMFGFGVWWYACPDGSFARWVDGIEIHKGAEHHINDCAAASANARKKRGMK
jgi:hypothetical protein